jgi:hypothetical protein
MTAFYKHPVEIPTDSALAAVIMYPLLGSSLEGALWFNFFAAAGELFYHANIRTPHWVKYFIQTPELHSIHHQLDVHTTTTRTCRYGIACSEPIAMPTRSPHAAAFHVTTNGSLAVCCCSATFTKTRVSRLARPSPMAVGIARSIE